jgi:uncharacterized protein
MIKSFSNLDKPWKSSMLKSYFTLRKRIDRFSSSVRSRYGEEFTCHPGCAECCEAGLTVVIVEAVVIGESLGIEENRIFLQAGQPALQSEGKCAFLDNRDFCKIYGAHPLICRTHGLALKYPEQKQIEHCTKNFVGQTPHGSTVLDATSTETALFAVNLEYCQRAGLNPMTRVAMDRIASLVDC